MNDGSRVVVVGGLPETTEVLRAVLEPQGISVVRCRQDQLPECERTEHPPRILIWHEERHETSSTGKKETQPTRWSHIPRILIRQEAPTEVPRNSHCREGVLPLPFHFGELLSVIDQLLKKQSGSSGEYRRPLPPAERTVAPGIRRAA